MNRQGQYVAILTLLVLAGACESGVEPEADAGPGEPVPFAAVISEGEVRIGPGVYGCGQWATDVPPEGDDLYLDLIEARLDELSWFTDRGTEILHVFEASDVLGGQVRVRLPRDRMDEWRTTLPWVAPLNHALGVVNLERHDVVFWGSYHGDETELRETVTAAGGVVVGRWGTFGSTYTIILPDAEMKSFAEGLGARFDWMQHRSGSCLEG